MYSSTLKLLVKLELARVIVPVPPVAVVAETVYVVESVA